MNKLAFIVLILLSSLQMSQSQVAAQETQDSVVQSEVVNINSASLETLTLLPGIGKAKAAAIIKFREDFGPFEDIEDLLEVKGIGRKLLKRIEGNISL